MIIRFVHTELKKYYKELLDELSEEDKQSVNRATFSFYNVAEQFPGVPGELVASCLKQFMKEKYQVDMLLHIILFNC